MDASAGQVSSMVASAGQVSSAVHVHESFIEQVLGNHGYGDRKQEEDSSGDEVDGTWLFMSVGNSV